MRRWPYQQVPDFMAELRERQGVDARALEFLVLCASRTSEVLGAVWNEIDLDQRMCGRLCKIPTARSLSGTRCSRFVFVREAGIVHDTLRQLTQKMRPGCTTHGFRSAFRTWADETQHVEHAVAEAALAHVRGDKVEQAYRRGDMLAKRARLMQTWADFCASRPATLLPLREAAR
jgi:integrase